METKVFISYSWDGEEHQEWVEQLATKLEDSQNNLMLFNTKIDFLNSIGGAYSPKN